MDTEEYTMRELTDIELNEVAGGNPFSFSINSGSFAIGAVVGDFSPLTAVTMTFAGQVNTVGTNVA